MLLCRQAFRWHSSREPSCGRCAQVEELLHLVTELGEDVSRLKIIVIGDSTPFWREQRSVCQLLQEACCLPRPKVRDVTRKLPTLVLPLGKPMITNPYFREIARNCNKKPKGNQERCDWSLSLKALGWLAGHQEHRKCFLCASCCREW